MSEKIAETNEEFNGRWIVPKIPEGFNKILKMIGYSTLERQYFKKSNISIYSTLKDGILTIKVDSPVYKNTKEYRLNGELNEYTDDRKNKIIEFSHLIAEKTVQTTTIYPDKKITVIDTRELISPMECKHTLQAIPDGGEHVEVEIIYTKYIEP